MTRRSPRSLGLGVVLSFVAACSSSTPPAARPYAPPPQRYVEAAPAPAFADPQRRAKLEAAFPTIDRRIELEMKAHGVPGLAVAIVIDGQVAYAKGFGVSDLAKKTPARADTVYRIGSITKSFTALAILWLRDQGIVGVDDPLARWIPEASGLLYPTRDARPITLRQMMDHSSGLPSDAGFPRRDAREEQVIAAIAGLPLDRAPGLKSSYSNLGFSLLGIVVGRASRSSLHDVVAQRIWKPLGMTSTFWESEDVPADRLAPAYRPSATGPVPAEQRERLGAADGSGGIYASVEDMARYVAFQLDAYPPRDDADTAPIRRASRREAHSTGIHWNTQVALAPGAAAPGEPMVHVVTATYGFGWQREETCHFDELVGHGGIIDSYRADVSFLPSRGVGVAVLSNFGATNAQAFSRVILDELRKTGALAARVDRLDPAFEPVAKQFMAVMDRYDDAAMKAMLDPERPPLPEEKDELAGYKALHGRCTGFHAVEVMSPTQATIGFTCERGRFEVMFQLAAQSRKVVGFVGTSHDVTAPPALAAAATAIAAQIGRWDDAVHAQYLSKALPPRDEMKRGFATIAAFHGACTVRTPTHVGFDWTFELDCERGGGMELAIRVDPSDRTTVVGMGFSPLQRGMCPLR